MLKKLKSWWLGLTDIEQRHTSALLLISVGFLCHYVAFTAFFIEDAAITFAYARNVVEGQGFATFQGGERVEGFSNPLWTFILAALYLVKIDPFIAAKFLGGIFGVLTLPFVYGIARRCRPNAEDNIALIPPLFLAASTTYVIWAGAGLENPLFNLLLASGLYRVLLESEQPNRRPLSALLMCGLAMTRPEGILYAAIAGGFRLLLALRDKRVVRPVGLWLVAFFAPFIAYQAWRLSYFGWPWPNTYYAKLDGENRFQPWKFGTKGWAYVENYMKAYLLAYIMPLYAIALVGLRDRRRWIVVGLTLVGAPLFLWDASLSFEWLPSWWTAVERHWDMLRVLFLLFAVAILGVGTLFHAGAIPRLLVLCIGLAATFFAIYSGGDWMKQWRWASMISIPNFLLLGISVGALLDALPAKKLIRVPKFSKNRDKRFYLEPMKLRTLVGFAVLAIVMAPNVWNTAFSAPEPETSVKDVRRRVEYMALVQDRLHLDRVTLMDVDMGAHMWFSHEDELRGFGVIAPSWKIVDMAGLVDVPMSRHIYQRPFMQEYIFEERNPTFAHVHGGWARKTRIPRLTGWDEDYLEIPGYPTGRTAFHVGNHVRKDIFVRDSYEGSSDRRVRFEQGITLEGVDVLAPEIPENGRLYLEIWLRAGVIVDDFRILAILDNGEGDTHLAELPPGYDWYRPSEWRRNEHVIGRFDFSVPDRLPVGQYDLGIVLMNQETGEVINPVSFVADSPVRVMRGATFFDDAVEIVTNEAAHDEALLDFETAIDVASNGECEAAWESWRAAQYHVWRDIVWRGVRRPALDEAIGACYVARAESSDTEEDVVVNLVEARLWDHENSDLLEQARPLAAVLSERGDGLFAEEDWEGAFTAYSTAMQLDPRLSGTRRSAEAARDLRLEIIGKERDSDRNRREREETREERRLEREAEQVEETTEDSELDVQGATPMERVQERLRRRSREGGPTLIPAPRERPPEGGDTEDDVVVEDQ